jgi:hypothetical protein
MKLSKKSGQAYLTLESNENGQLLVQDIPVALQTIQKLRDSEEPNLSAPKVRLFMPPGGKLLIALEKMKSASDSLAVTIEMDGKRGIMNFSVENSSMIMKMHFKGLLVQPSNNPPHQNASSPSASDSEPTFTRFHISIQKLIRVLSYRALKSSVVVGCLVEDGAFVIFNRLADDRGTATFYIPLLAEES